LSPRPFLFPTASSLSHVGEGQRIIPVRISTGPLTELLEKTIAQKVSLFKDGVEEACAIVNEKTDEGLKKGEK